MDNGSRASSSIAHSPSPIPSNEALSPLPPAHKAQPRQGAAIAEETPQRRKQIAASRSVCAADEVFAALRQGRFQRPIAPPPKDRERGEERERECVCVCV